MNNVICEDDKRLYPSNHLVLRQILSDDSIHSWNGLYDDLDDIDGNALRHMWDDTTPTAIEASTQSNNIGHTGVETACAAFTDTASTNIETSTEPCFLCGNQKMTGTALQRPGFPRAAEVRTTC